MNVSKPIVLILGMPGSGKTTIGRELSQLLGILHRSTGDVLRAGRASSNPPPNNDPATWFLEQELLRIEIESVRGLILDFSPVTKDGAGQMANMLREHEFRIRHVVYVKTRIGDAEGRYVSRGCRPGDATEDLRLLFKRRIVQEFWPYTLPMIRRATEQRILLILKNSGEESVLKKEVARVAGIIAAPGH